MPLSEEELRLLEQMERALVADDPKLASTLRGASIRRHARRRAYLAGGAFLVGVVVLMTGAVMSMTIVGIVGFVVMLGSAYVFVTAWRRGIGPSDVDEIQQAIRDCGDGKMLLYCRVGNRSALAADVMLRMGFPRVFNVQGGIERWRHLGFPAGFH